MWEKGGSVAGAEGARRAGRSGRKEAGAVAGHLLSRAREPKAQVP